MDIPPPRLVFDPATARLEREWKHARPLIGCRFDPSGRFLFVSAEDDSVQRYDLLSGTKTAFTGHESWVRGLAFVAPTPPVAPDFEAWQKQLDATQVVVGFGVAVMPAPRAAPFTLISADYHGKLIWWQGDADAPKPLKTVAAHEGYARAVVVSPDGSTVASCGNDHLIKLWKAADGSAVRALEGHESHVYNCAFSPDGTRLVSCDLKGIVKDWNLKTGKCERDIDAKLLHKYDPTFMADIGGARGMAFKSDGSTVAVCGITNVSNAFAGIGNPAVALFDWKEGKTKLLKLKAAFQGTAWGVAFHPSGAVIAAGGAGQGRVWFFKGDEMDNVHTLNLPANCRDLAISPAGDRFAVAGANGSAYVYDFNGTIVSKTAPAPVPLKK
jgi:WD40 repeat protein